MKTSSLATVAFIFSFASSAAQAANWFLPLAQEATQIRIQNLSATAQPVWTDPPHHDGNLDQEKSYVIDPHATLILPAPFAADAPESFLQIKAQSADLQVAYGQSGDWHQLSEGRANQYQTTDLTDAQALVVTNLEGSTQKIECVLKTTAGAIETRSILLTAFGQSKVSLSDAFYDRVQLRGEMNLTAHLITSTGLRFLSPRPQAIFAGLPKETHFVVESADHTQSFTVAISDPELIRQAREQIAFPNDFRARILIGQIQTGSAQVNQNLKSTLQAPWSWHVSRVLKFAEMASQGCDGSPDFLEDFLQSWLQTRSTICFWTYRITREL